jgi:glutamine synthetase
MIALNTAVAKQLVIFNKEVNQLVEDGVKKDEAILQILRKYIIESKAVRFDGNGYSKEWEEEAAKRGLTNIKVAPESLKAFKSAKYLDLFQEMNVLSHREMEARYEVSIEKYSKKLQIESRVLADLALNHIVPTAIKYQSLLIDNVKGLKDIFSDKEFKELSSARLELIKDISVHISTIKLNAEEMRLARKKANAIDEIEERVAAYAYNIKPYFEKIRYSIDKLERIVDDELWPLPKYREILSTL